MNKYFYPGGIFISMVVVIYLLGKVHWEINDAVQQLPGFNPSGPLGIAIIKMSLLGLIFGILMNWKGLKTIYVCKKVKLNSMFILALLTLALALVPHYFWNVCFGLGTSGLMGFPNALATREVHLLISVLSGYLIIHSITPERE